MRKRSQKQLRYAVVTTVAVLFTSLGIHYLAGSHAATPFLSAEAESGVLSGAKTVADTTASGGSAVSFVAGSTPATPCIGVPISAGPDTIQAAIAASPDNTVLCLSAGLYRTTTVITPKTGQSLVGTAGTIIDGSVQPTNWRTDGNAWAVSGVLGNGNGGGQCDDNTTNPCFQTNPVFRNDVHLNRVMSRSAVGPGNFYADYSTNNLYVGDNPAGQRVEVAHTPYAIQSSAANVTIKGLTIQKFASDAQRGAVYAQGTNWKILNNTIRWNHAVGLYLAVSNGTLVDGNKMVENGQLGMSHYRSIHTTVTNNEFGFNNTEGFWAADWESGGYKTTWTVINDGSTNIFKSNYAHDNKGIGVWVDIDNNNIDIDSNRIEDNWADGIRYEISYHSVIRNNVIKRNGLKMPTIRGGGTSLFATAGININHSSHVEVYGNTVADNQNGIGMQMRTRCCSATYGGGWELTDNYVHDNTVTMKSGTGDAGTSGIGVLSNTNDYLTKKNNKFSHNTYILDSLSARRFMWYNPSNGSRTFLDSAGWKAANEPDATFSL